MDASPAQIVEWKRLYGEIFSINTKGIDYIFRPLSFYEYDQLGLMRVNSVEAEDFIVASALLSPDPNTATIAAGLVTILAEEILHLSGYGNPKRSIQILNAKRERMSESRTLMKAFVIYTMPAYKEEDLDQLNFGQLAAKVALAEQIITLQQAVAQGSKVSLDLIDPEEEAAKEAAAKEKERKKLERYMRSHGKDFDPDTAPPLKPKIDPNDPIAQKLRQALG